MIVVDTNVLVYLYLPVPQTAAAVSLMREDSDWRAPLLWRSEFRNVLMGYHRKDLLSLRKISALAVEAESLMDGREHGVESAEVLSLAAKSGCSAYDCEFVALSQQLRTVLVTADARLAKAFPDAVRRLT